MWPGAETPGPSDRRVPRSAGPYRSHPGCWTARTGSATIAAEALEQARAAVRAETGPACLSSRRGRTDAVRRRRGCADRHRSSQNTTPRFTPSELGSAPRRERIEDPAAHPVAASSAKTLSAATWRRARRAPRWGCTGSGTAPAARRRCDRSRRPAVPDVAGVIWSSVEDCGWPASPPCAGQSAIGQRLPAASRAEHERSQNENVT